MPTSTLDIKTDLHGSTKKLEGMDDALEGMQEQAKKSGKSIEDMGEKFKNAGQKMAIAGAVIIAGLVLLVKGASDAEETTTKFGTVFQDVFEEASLAVKNLNDNYGLSRNAAMEMLGATGDLLTGLGLTGKAALDLSLKTQTLAVDLASFTNFSGGAKGASEALTKAMLGEREMVKSLGIVITEEMIKEKLLTAGKDKLRGMALLQAKAEFTLQIAVEQSRNAMGDYQRTQDGLANSSRELSGDFEDLRNTIGEKLIPVAKGLVNIAKEIVGGVQKWADAHPELSGNIMILIAALGGIMLILGPFLIILPQISASLKILKASSFAAAGGFTAMSTALGVLAAAFVGWKIGEQIGKIEVLGKTVNEHIRDAFNGAKIAAFDNTIAQNEMRTASFALERTLRRELNPAIIKNQEVVIVAKTKIELLKNEFIALKTPADLLTIAVLEFRDSLDGSLSIIEDTKDGIKILKFEMSDIPIVLEGVPATIESVLDSINFGKVAEDAAAAGLESSLALAQVGADLEKATAEQLKAMEAQAEKTEQIIQGIASNIGDIFGRAAIDILEGQRTLGESIGDIWKGIKSTIFGVIGDIVKEFIGNLVKNVLTGAVNMGSAMGEAGKVMAKTGKAIAGVGEGIGKLIENLAVGIGKAIEALAKSVANAARSLAAAAPQLVIVGAIALALFAGFSAIKSLFSGSGKGAEKGTDFLQEIRNKTFDIFNGAQWMWKTITGEQQVRLDNLIEKADWNLDATEGILGYQEDIKDNLDKIVDNTEDMVKELKQIPKSGGGGYFEKPTLTWMGDKGPEYAIPANKIGKGTGGNITIQMNINSPLISTTGNVSQGNVKQAAKALFKEIQSLSQMGRGELDIQALSRSEA